LRFFALFIPMNKALARPRTAEQIEKAKTVRKVVFYQCFRARLCDDYVVFCMEADEKVAEKKRQEFCLRGDCIVLSRLFVVPDTEIFSFVDNEKWDVTFLPT
jgi:hypothetical protein